MTLHARTPILYHAMRNTVSDAECLPRRIMYLVWAHSTNDVELMAYSILRFARIRAPKSKVPTAQRDILSPPGSSTVNMLPHLLAWSPCRRGFARAARPLRDTPKHRNGALDGIEQRTAGRRDDKGTAQDEARTRDRCSNPSSSDP